MGVTKIDRLFALKALKKKVDEEYKLLEGECRQDLLEAYAEDGSDRRTSTLFGPDAGKFSIKHIKGSEGGTERSFKLTDDAALAEWLEENHGAALRYAMLNAADFGRYWAGWSGEVPDGIEVEETHIPAMPDTLSAQVYNFKPELVFEKLGDNYLKGVNELLLGDGE